ncbi:MAG TPA: methyltransferase domain-containing protein [Ktedonobacteraceae bacterium]|nr:methyltransferase domain-containing protein [Ktedonobacteraceae bacterium]
MSSPANPRRERPSTYFVQDRSSEEELTRLLIQDQMMTAGMGGVLPEQPDPTIFRRVLDVGCGPGGWIFEVARTYPDMSRFVGVDVSNRMVEYARAQAANQHLNNRVEFYAMDALRMLEFPPDSFDLVNQRAGGSYLRTWDWPKLLSEYLRVTRKGGVVRITEANIIESTSPAFTRHSDLLFQALWQSGHYFTKAWNGLTTELVPLLQRAGIQNVQTRSFKLEYRSGTDEGQRFAEDIGHFFHTILPFLRKWTQVPEDYEDLCQQALQEMRQPDFVATWNMLTVWGKVPPSK